MQLNGDLLDIVGENLSTQPRLHDATPKRTRVLLPGAGARRVRPIGESLLCARKR